MIQHTITHTDTNHNTSINLITVASISYLYYHCCNGTKNTKNFKKIENLEKDIHLMGQMCTKARKYRGLEFKIRVKT